MPDAAGADHPIELSRAFEGIPFAELQFKSGGDSKGGLRNRLEKRLSRAEDRRIFGAGSGHSRFCIAGDDLWVARLTGILHLGQEKKRSNHT